MLTIPLTGCGGNHVALIDSADHDLVSQYHWIAVRQERVNLPDEFIALAWLPMVNGIRGKAIYMHNLIMGASGKGNDRVDHIDHSTLNNQRSNLRKATAHQNNGNVRKYTGRYIYKGVHKNDGYTWSAYIEKNGVAHSSNGHLTIESAARGYDALAREYFGAFAYLNFPQFGEQGLFFPGNEPPVEPTYRALNNMTGTYEAFGETWTL